MYVIIWEFRIKRGAERAFEQVYGPDGAWAQLFRQGAGYLGTELLHDPRDHQRYFTLDRWHSSEAYARFRAHHHDAYAALDQQCAPLTEQETLLGTFQPIPTA